MCPQGQSPAERNGPRSRLQKARIQTVEKLPRSAAPAITASSRNSSAPGRFRVLCALRRASLVNTMPNIDVADLRLPQLQHRRKTIQGSLAQLKRETHIKSQYEANF